MRCAYVYSICIGTVCVVLPGEDADFDFRLIEPASVLGCVVNGKAVPDLAAHLGAESVLEGFAAMDIEIVHDEVDGLSRRVCQRQVADYSRKFKPGTIRRRECKVASRLGLYCTE